MIFIQKQALWVSRDAEGNIVLHFPTSHVAYIEGAVATVNGATPDENKNVTIDVGVKKVNDIAPDADGNVAIEDYITGASINGKTITLNFKDGTYKTLTTQDTVPTDYVSNLAISGKTITATFKDGTTKTLTTQDTTYSEATTSTAGLMSASDKTKLNSLGSSGSGVFYATCSTASGTAAKVATVTSGSFSLTKGVTVIINSTNKFFEGSLSASSKTTLNVNSTGAKNIRANNGTVLTQRYSASENDKNIIMVYDGTYWMPMNCGTFKYNEASN